MEVERMRTMLRRSSQEIDHGSRSRVRSACRSKLEREGAAARARLQRLVEQAKAATDEEARGDDVDRAASAAQVATLLSTAERERSLLRDIERALAKLDSGDFGICEGTGERIEPLRLLARPWTRYSVAYLEEREEAAKRHLM